MANRNSAFAIVMLATAGVAPAMSAHAADLAPPYLGSQQFPEDKVEFGSGWYIRGDLGATRLPSISVNSPSTPTPPKAGAPISSNLTPLPPTASIQNGSALGYTASLGAGYQINSWFRADVIADFHKPVTATASSGNGSVFCPTAVSYPTDPVTGLIINTPTYANGGCTGSYATKLSSYDVLVNGYIDIGTWHSVTPYVGAGVGLAFGHYQNGATYRMANNNPYQVSYTDAFYNTTFTQNYDRQSSGTYYNFAWALMAGFAVDVYDHTKLDIGYRYVNLGAIPGLSGKLTSQEVRGGVRYMIDN